MYQISMMCKLGITDFGEYGSTGSSELFIGAVEICATEMVTE